MAALEAQGFALSARVRQIHRMAVLLSEPSEGELLLRYGRPQVNQRP